MSGAEDQESSRSPVALNKLNDPKWQLPGWRIEQRYSTGVLIGNWSEDRLGKFHRGTEFGNSTNRVVYQPYDPHCFQPDVAARRRGLLRSDGLGKDQIFTHHGTRYMRNMMSLYDQQFNRKHCSGQRKWDRHRLAWLPEASDHPLQGESTRFGLKETLGAKWKELQELETHGDFSSTYSTSFKPHSKDASPATRVATPRHLSSHLHPHRVNKDLHLRGHTHMGRPEVVDSRLLQAREKLSVTI